MANKPKTENENGKRPFVRYDEMNDREKGIFFQGQNFKERNIKEKMGMFVPHKQGKN